MTGNEYFGVLRTFGWTHAEAAEFLGVSKWTSIAWRNNRQAVPRAVELALLSEFYRMTAGPVLSGIVNGQMTTAKKLAPQSAPYERTVA